ncbi:MAG: hypothetical protein ACR2LS_04975, partial [Thermomicrobiales bacterium]
MAATLATPNRTTAQTDKTDRGRFWAIIAIIAAAVYPFIDSALGFNRLGSWLAIMVFVILAMGLNIVVG